MNSPNSNVTPYNVDTTVDTPFPSHRVLIIFITWFVVGISGNSLAIFMLILNSKSHQWKIFYKLVLLLALSDLIAQTVTIPIMIVQFVNRNLLVTGGLWCNLMSTVVIMTSLMSVLYVCLMSVDRFIGTWFPIFYRRNATSCHVYFAAVSVTVVSVFVGLLPLLGVNTHKLQKERTWCFVDMQPKEEEDRVFFYLCATIGISAVFLMMTMNGMVVIKSIEMHRKPSKFPRSHVGSEVRHLQNIAFLLMAMVFFMVAWIPVIIRFMNSALGWNDNNHQEDKIAVSLTAIHQVSNPWIYILMRDCLFSRVLKFGRKHSKSGRIFDRISMNTQTI